MYKAVIFDLDGTLLNTLDDLGDSGNVILEQLGFPTHGIEEYKYFVGNGIPKLVERMLPAGTDEATVKKALGLFQAHYAGNMKNKTAPYDGMIALLDKLKAAGLKIAVVTNKQHDLAVEVVHDYFGDRFDEICGAREDLPKKPAPDGTLELVKTFGFDKSEIMYIGDSNVDMMTAQNAGLEKIGVLWGFRTENELRECGATNLAHKADDIAQIIFEA